MKNIKLILLILSLMFSVSAFSKPKHCGGSTIKGKAKIKVRAGHVRQANRNGRNTMHVGMVSCSRAKSVDIDVRTKNITQINWDGDSELYIGGMK